MKKDGILKYLKNRIDGWSLKRLENLLMLDTKSNNLFAAKKPEYVHIS